MAFERPDPITLRLPKGTRNMYDDRSLFSIVIIAVKADSIQYCIIQSVYVVRKLML